MNVYRITADYTDYLAFHLPMKDLIPALGKSIPPKQLMHFYKHNISLTSVWGDVSGSFAAVNTAVTDTQVPDLNLWSSGSLVFSDRAKTIVENSIAALGEFLPVRTTHGQFWIFNCLNMVGADESRSARVMEAGQVAEIDEIYFHEADIASNAVFKTEFDACKAIYCNEDFHKLLEAMDLKGVCFSQDLASVF